MCSPLGGKDTVAGPRNFLNFFRRHRWAHQRDRAKYSTPYTTTKFNTPNCIDSVLGASYLATCSEPSWTFKAHSRQPFTMTTWTIGHAILNASTFHRSASYNNSTALQQFYFCTTTMAYTGDSSSPSARPTTAMLYTLTPSINDIQTWNLI